MPKFGSGMRKKSSNISSDIPISGGSLVMHGVTDLPECFYLLLSDEFYDQLLLETNCYAVQQREENNTSNPWNPLPKKIL